MPSTSALNPKQERFVAEFLISLNATKAAIAAGYSKKTAESQGSRLLRNGKVEAAIAEAQAKRAARVGLTQDQVLSELKNIGYADVGRAFDETGCLLPLKEMPEDVRRAIASVETEEITDRQGNRIGTVRKVKFWDKPRTLELSGKHLGMFTDKVALSGTLVVEVHKYEREPT